MWVTSGCFHRLLRLMKRFSVNMNAVLKMVVLLWVREAVEKGFVENKHWPSLCLFFSGEWCEGCLCQCQERRPVSSLKDRHRGWWAVSQRPGLCLQLPLPRKLLTRTTAKLLLRLMTNSQQFSLLCWHFWRTHLLSRAADSGCHQESIEEVGPGVRLPSAAAPRGWPALLRSVPTGLH